MESAWGETIYTKTLKDSAEEQNIEWKNQGRRKREPCCFLSSFFAFLLDRHWIVEASIWFLISFTLELHEYGTAAWLLNTSVWDLTDLMKLEDLEEEQVQVRVKVCHKKKKIHGKLNISCSTPLKFSSGSILQSCEICIFGSHSL